MGRCPPPYLLRGHTLWRHPPHSAGRQDVGSVGQPCSWGAGLERPGLAHAGSFTRNSGLLLVLDLGRGQQDTATPRPAGGSRSCWSHEAESFVPAAGVPGLEPGQSALDAAAEVSSWRGGAWRSLAGAYCPLTGTRRPHTVWPKGDRSPAVLASAPQGHPLPCPRDTLEEVLRDPGQGVPREPPAPRVGPAALVPGGSAGRTVLDGRGLLLQGSACRPCPPALLKMLGWGPFWGWGWSAQ